MQHSRIVSVMALAGLVAACRSAAPSARPSAPQAPDFLQTLVGQSRIVPGLSGAKGLALTRKDLGKPRPACDAAVEVRQARFENDSLELRLEIIGRPRLAQSRPAAARGSKCGPLPREVDLTISGFAADEGAAALQAALDQVLQSPEAYLQAHGASVGALPADDPKAVVASNDPTAAPERQALWRRLTAQPRTLLSVDAEYHNPARKARHEGEVQFRAVAGANGRLRDVQLQTPLAAEHEAQVQRVLALWRLEPARGPQGPVPAVLDLRVILKVD